MTRESDMAVVIILSHGADNGRIVCSDGLMIDIEEDVYKWVNIKKKKKIHEQLAIFKICGSFLIFVSKLYVI